MSVKKMVYIGFLPLLPALILLLNSGLLQNDEALFSESPSIQNQISTPLKAGAPLMVQEEAVKTLNLSGEVRPRNEVDIFPDTQGKIKELRVEAGDQVRPDQILALLDPSRPGMNYTLNPVKSSIAGTVTAVYTDPGAFITPAQPICRIGTLSQLEVEVYVPEGSIELVYKGMVGHVSSPVIPSLDEEVYLKSLSPVVDPFSRSMKVTFVPKERDNRLKSGMFVDLALELK